MDIPASFAALRSVQWRICLSSLRQFRGEWCSSTYRKVRRCKDDHFHGFLEPFMRQYEMLAIEEAQCFLLLGPTPTFLIGIPEFLLIFYDLLGFAVESIQPEPF